MIDHFIIENTPQPRERTDRDMIKTRLQQTNRIRSNLHGHRERTPSVVKESDILNATGYDGEWWTHGDKVSVAYTHNTWYKYIHGLSTIKQVAYTFSKWLRNA